jgi:Mg2+/Co2+ transporter CorB
MFSVACFTMQLVGSKGVSVAYLIGSVVVLGIIIYNQAQIAKKRKVYYSRALLIAALVWMKMPYFQWLVFLFIILALLEYQAKYSVEIGFSDNEIVINSLLKKRYAWKDFSNIVLRDGLLTLDFTNNRILQREVEDDEDDDADEDEFNDYCKKQLASVVS